MPRVRIKFVSSVLLFVYSVLGAARAQSDGVIGHWLSEDGGGVIAIERCGASICGKLDWFKGPPSADNPLAQDIRNPDPALRAHPLCGLTILYGFKPMSGGRGWEEGHVYSPEKGSTYHANVVIVDATHIKLRGYIGIPLLGESQVWSRADAGHEKCK